MDIDSALEELSGIRDQLASSTRFQGFAPTIVALTGGLALALMIYQLTQNISPLNEVRLVTEWIFLAIISSLLIGTEAIIRARRLHHAMADTMVNSTLRRFLPVGLAGIIIFMVILVRQPTLVWILPSLSQLLIGIGIFAALSSLPKQVIWGSIWYFTAGSITLIIAVDNQSFSPWLMGIPYGLGQIVMAILLYISEKGKKND